MSMRTLFVVSFLFLALGTRAAATPALSLSAPPFTDPLRQEAVFLSLTNLLSSELGMEVGYTPVASYEALIDAFAHNKVDVAFVGVVSYVEARQRAGVRVILQPIRDGRSYYRGAFVVPRDSAIQSIADLRGKRVAFVDQFSTAGYLYPRKLLLDAGFDPARDLGSIVFAGGHAQVVEMVAKGDVDAGACFKGARRFLADPDTVRELVYTELIPNDPVVVRESLPPGVVQRLREIFLDLRFQPHAKVFFELMDLEGFLPATDDVYAPVVAAVEKMRGKP
jgi:phosphonate transport system substrate-binding protein